MEQKEDTRTEFFINTICSSIFEQNGILFIFVQFCKTKTFLGFILCK